MLDGTIIRPCCVVTGANRGLGLALLRGLAMEVPQARVICTARTSAAAIHTAAILRSERLDVEAYAAPLNVADMQDVASFWRYADDELGSVDLLINNAAVCEEGWCGTVVGKTLRTNVIGPMEMMCAALPRMLRRGRGHVVNISSGDGELLYLNPALQDELRSATSARAVLRALVKAAPPRNAFGAEPAHSRTPAYALSKAALNALTRIAAAKLPAPESRGVRVSAVCPGDVLTRMCTEEYARNVALLPSVAAEDVLWLAIAGLQPNGIPASGRFWRARQQISF